MHTTVPTGADADAPVPSDGASAALWNPTAAALWSLLLTPAFGAWLHMRNWDRLGRPEQARQARWWFAGLLALALASYALAGAEVVLGREGLTPPWWVGLGVFSFWGVAAAYPQISLVDDRHGERYERRSWGGVLAIGLVANCAMPIVAVVAAGYRTAAGY